MVPRRCHIHDAVDDERGALEAVEHTGLECPDRDQTSDVLGVDLFERAITVAIVSAPVHQPVGVIAA